MNIRSPLARAMHQKLIEDNTVHDTTEVNIAVVLVAGKVYFAELKLRKMLLLETEDYIRRENSRKISKHFRYLP